MAFYCNGKKDICECDILCADCKHYDNTGGKKWQTNADRIRAMSDEELEEFIRKIAIGYEPWCDRHCNMDGDGNCNLCLSKWLKQSAEEHDNG